MAAGDSKTVSGAVQTGRSQGVTLTGLTAATAYIAEVTFPNGQTSAYPFTTDGSGAFTPPAIPATERGLYTMTIKTVPSVAYTTTWRVA